MQTRVRTQLLLFTSALFLALMPLPALAGEGFGMFTKKTANLTRVRPPQVFITGTKVAVRASSQDRNVEPAAQRLQSQLESQLISNDRRLSIDASKPQTIIDVKLLQDEYGEKWESRRMQQQYDTGQKDSKGRHIYQTREVTVNFKIVHHSFSAAYKVFEPGSGRSLLADTLNSNFQSEFQEGNGAPDASSLEAAAINSVAGNITTQLTSTKEIVGVLLPKGSFEAAAAFAEAGLWSKYLEALEKMMARSNAADEAYRHYAMGVAYEALGYGAESADTTLKYLEQAATHYNNAIDANPKEGYFRQAYQSMLQKGTARAPLERVQEALVQYQKLKEFADASTNSQGGASASGSKGDLGGGDSTVTNQSVIQMIQAGLSEDVITTAIDSAPATAFDVSPKGLIQLSEAKVSKKLMQHIQSVASKGAKPAQKPSQKQTKTSHTKKS